MKINSINNYNSRQNPVFKGIYTSNAAKKTFKFAEENGALFVAATTFVLSTLVRPLVILATPDTDKENKRYAAAKSIASSIVGFGLMFAATKPLTKAIQKIDKNPEKYLSKKTIEKLKEKNHDLKNSKPYIFISQLLKLGAGFALALPKAALTCALMLPIFDLFWEGGKNRQQKGKNPSFKGHFSGNIKADFLPRKIGKFYNSDFAQKMSEKFKNSNYEMGIICATDILATLGFVHQNKKSQNMTEKQKRVLNRNVIYGTAMSILGAITLDKALESKTEKFIEKFKKANPTLKNPEKYAEGIKITKKVFLLGGLYYIAIPLAATFLADKSEK